MGAPQETRSRSEFLDSLQKGVLLGVALLALVLPPATVVHRSTSVAPHAAAPSAPASAAPATRVLPASLDVRPRLADFGSFLPTPEVRQLANWAVHTRDHQDHAIVIVDKKDARLYVFDRSGKLKDTAAVLLGSAIGDYTVPGVGDKPIAQVLPEERTTPAGRFLAEIGMNLRGEDVVWVDYDSAVSMHRVLTTNPAERRLERLATPTVEDNRISYGCINVPRDFFETVLSPTVRTSGAIIYILPDEGTPEELFGSYDVESHLRLARR
jgi:hypothetical protein